MPPPRGRRPRCPSARSPVCCRTRNRPAARTTRRRSCGGAAGSSPTAGGEARLVLLVDDAHLLDDASATLAHRLAESGSAFVLATVRAGEPVPDAVEALGKDGGDRFDLAGLGDGAVTELLAAALGGPVEPSAVARLAKQCDGNVLFLRELVMGAQAAGTLTRTGPLWRLTGPSTPSQRLVDLVETRLSGLDEAERSVLGLVAVGEPLGPAELAGLVDPELVDSLERRALLRSRSSGRRIQVGLAHPLYGEVLRARMSALRLRSAARALADSAQATGGRRQEDLLRLAAWRLDGGGEVDPEQMVAAARRARALFDFALAERLLRAGIACGAGAEAQVYLGELLFQRGCNDEAVELATALVETVEDPLLRRRLTALRIDSLGWAGRLDEALTQIVVAAARDLDPFWQDQLAAKQGMFVYYNGRTAEAIALLEPLLNRARSQALVETSVTAAWSLGLAGRTAESVAAGRAGEAAGVESPISAWYPLMHPLTRSRALTWAGCLDEAQQVAEAGYAQALAQGADEPRAWFANGLAEVHELRGRPVTACRYAEESVEILRPMGRGLYFRGMLLNLAGALILAGRTADAQGVVDEAQAQPPGVRTQQAKLLRAQAWIAVARGDLPAARAALAGAEQVAARAGDLVLRAAALHDLARLGRPREVVEPLRALAGCIEGPLAPARAEHVVGLADADPLALASASEAFEHCGALLFAAEAAADACLLWRRISDVRAAAEAEARARALAEHCEGACTPTLARLGARVDLTPTEREVAMLAAAGRSNRDIAEALHLSRGTVQNYLHHVYDKLGISGREQLGAALAR